MVASTKELMSSCIGYCAEANVTVPSSNGIPLGTVPKQMLSGLRLELMKPSHSSMTTKVVRILLFLKQVFFRGSSWG